MDGLDTDAYPNCIDHRVQLRSHVERVYFKLRLRLRHFSRSYVCRIYHFFSLLCKRGWLVKSPSNALCYSKSQKKIEKLSAFPCLFSCVYMSFEGPRFCSLWGYMEFPHCQPAAIIIRLDSDFLLRFLFVLCTDKCINDTSFTHVSFMHMPVHNIWWTVT